MNKLTIIFLSIVIGLGSTILGYSVGRINSGPSQESQALLQSLKDLPEGSELVISSNELETIVDEKEYNGATSEKVYFRMLSWFGTGAVEGASGDQGIKTDEMTVGASRGQGWVIGLWKFIKSIFWFVVIYFAIWLLCSALSLVYPPLAIVATIMAAIATGGLSVISGIFNWIKTKRTETALAQTVSGIDSYKTANPEQKDIINNELKIAQDSNSKDVVDAIRK